MRFEGDAPCRVVTAEGSYMMPTFAAALQRFDPEAFAELQAAIHASFGDCVAALEEYADEPAVAGLIVGELG